MRPLLTPVEAWLESFGASGWEPDLEITAHRVDLTNEPTIDLKAHPHVNVTFSIFDVGTPRPRYAKANQEAVNAELDRIRRQP